MFLLLKAKYLLGENSIENRKKERLYSALDEYFTFTDEFPESSYLLRAHGRFASKVQINRADTRFLLEE